jgi:beta-lactamase regulating signal transducer with metallopeptidase domain
MTAFLLYIIKSTGCLTLFYLGYKVLLSDETFFGFNRKVLLWGMLISLVLPLITLKTHSPAIIQQPMIQLERLISITNEENQTQTATFSAEAMETEGVETGKTGESIKLSFPSCSVAEALIFFFMLGGMINLVLLVRSCVCLRQTIRRGRKIRKENYCLIILNENVIPFNYGKYIVLSEDDYRNHPDMLLTHELTHFRKNHTLDLVFMEFIILFHWFNPAVWLLKRELQGIHEFQADTEVLKQGINATKYQLLLVKKAAGSGSYTFANSFNHSKLKKRITMMLKKKSNSWARLRLTLLIPLAVITLNAFARPEINRIEESRIRSEGTTILQETQQAAENYFAAVEEVVKNVEDTIKTKTKGSIPPPPPPPPNRKSSSGTKEKEKQNTPPPPPPWIIEASSVILEKEIVTFPSKDGEKKYVVVNIIENPGKEKVLKDGKYPHSLKKGTTLKIDTILYKDYLYSQSFILTEQGDTIESIYPIRDKEGFYTIVNTSGEQKVKASRNGSGEQEVKVSRIPIWNLIHRKPQ